MNWALPPGAVAAGRRAFVYFPLLHSESESDQNAAAVGLAALATELPSAAPFYRAALEHRRAVVRFGRLPERNAVLGRESTAAELEWLGIHPTA